MQIKLPGDPSFSPAQLKACDAFVHSHLHDKGTQAEGANFARPGPGITISHQVGSGAYEIAARTGECLQRLETEKATAWTVFDRDLVEIMLEEHHLPQALAQLMPEDRRPYIQDVMDELTGVIPPSWKEVHLIAETVLHLVDAGHVILVGRGAGLITARVPNVLHVRLIASLPKRIEHVSKTRHLTPREAEEFIKKADRATGRYVKSHFHVHIGDDLLYHLVVNTDLFSFQEAAQLISDAARMCFQHDEPPPGRAIRILDETIRGLRRPEAPLPPR